MKFDLPSNLFVEPIEKETLIITLTDDEILQLLEDNTVFKDYVCHIIIRRVGD